MRVASRLQCALSLVFFAAILSACDGPTERAADDATRPQVAAAVVDDAETTDVADGPAREVARIAFEAVSRDLGEVWASGDYSCQFVFTNAGDDDLVIKEIKPACGCTVPTLPKRTFAPGEQGRMDVVFTPSGAGRQTKQIAVITNDPGQELVRLELAATVKPVLVIEPKMIDFGRLSRGERGETLVRISCADPDLAVQSIATTEGLHAEQVPADAGVGIRVHLLELVGLGEHRGYVEVSLRGHLIPDAPERGHRAVIHARALVLGELEYERSVFPLDVLPPGSSFEQTIRIQRRSERPFRVLGADIIQSTSHRFDFRAVAVEGAAGSAYDLVLSGDAGTSLGLIGGAALVRTDVPGEETLVFNFVGVVRVAEDG